MKRVVHFLKTCPRVLLVLMVGIAILAAAVPTTYALAPTKDITGEIDVVLGTKDISVYSGPLYEVPIHSFKVVMPRGSSHTLDFRAINTGQETLVQNVRMLPGTVPWGTLTLSRTDLGTLAPGNIADWSLTIDIPMTTNTGNYTTTMQLYEP